MGHHEAASISEGRFAFSGFDFYGLVFNPVGAAGVGAGVGWFGLPLEPAPGRLAASLRTVRPVRVTSDRPAHEVSHVLPRRHFTGLKWTPKRTPKWLKSVRICKNL
jgi:hypothetical protein